MSALNEKIRILLANNEWTQAHLAEKMHVSPKTVQKWCAGKNNPSLDTVKELCSIFYIPIGELTNDDLDIPEYYVIDRYLPYSCARLPEEDRDTEHTLIDAGLAGGAILHRFVNGGGAECSAIYQRKREVWWHYRENESRMIRDWNERYSDDR